MNRSPTTVCQIPNRIRIKAAQCKSSRIHAPIREKPLRSVMSYPNRRMVSVENIGLPHKLHTTAAARQLAPKARLTLWVVMGMMASLSAQTGGWVGLMAGLGVLEKTEISPHRESPSPQPVTLPAELCQYPLNPGQIV
jgi:hypothetical protein